MSAPRLVPPAPHVMAGLYADYLRVGKPNGLTFHQYLAAVGYTNRATRRDGMDDAARARPSGGGPMRVSVPAVPITGPLHIIVLLVDFPDQRGTRPAREYEDLLFSERTYPTGSLRDYYREVSGGRVDVTGTVHGWFRLPQRLRYYADGSSGLDGAYPRNARRMALDAVRAAARAGVSFDPTLDALGDGTVTGLFIVHAGRGAEVLREPDAGRTIWSHKWTLPTDVSVGPNLRATTYLTVPFDCLVGVCAHELGHLAFQWEDFYDPNGGRDGQLWDGSGRWDLMAGGSYNGDGGTRPAHPMGLHKSQHGWVNLRAVSATERVVIPPYTPAGGTVVRVDGPAYTDSQFLLLENRQRVGFDDNLPGAGLLVWRVDLARDQNGPARPAVQLVQADGRMDLEMGADLNQGDAGDPFPGATRRTAVPDTGPVSTSFPTGPRSGVTLTDIAVDAVTGDVAVTVTITDPTPVAPPALRIPILTPELAQALERLKLQPKVRPSELAPLVRAVAPPKSIWSARSSPRPVPAGRPHPPRLRRRSRWPSEPTPGTGSTRGGSNSIRLGSGSRGRPKDGSRVTSTSPRTCNRAATATTCTPRTPLRHCGSSAPTVR